jgi:transcriptional repressor NrdR
VIESRPVDGGAAVRRRRECEACEHRFTSFERYAEAVAVVRKRDGRRQAYDPEKLRAGLARAAHKQSEAERVIEAIVARVGEEARGSEEIASRRIGELCLEGLRDADRIAYLRFASVHKQLGDLEAISAELSELAISADFPPESPPADGSDSPDSVFEPARREVHA